MTNALNRIEPSWTVSQRIQAFCSTRQGGISKPPFNSLNLGLNAGDNLADVLQNRSIVRSELPAEPLWLKQIHGVTVSTPASRNALGSEPFEADSAVTNIPNEVLAILAADCMPVLFTSKDGDVIGAAHAGWRGLSGGVLENTINEMITLSPGLKTSDISAWLGPAIGPSAFEVGEDVLQAFAQQGKDILSKAFIPIIGTPGKYLADLYLLARDRLRALGIEQITGGEFCTLSNPERFFSYRRDKVTGRFASLIWIAESA
jgi:YfiH family protein